VIGASRRLCYRHVTDESRLGFCVAALLSIDGAKVVKEVANDGIVGAKNSFAELYCAFIGIRGSSVIAFHLVVSSLLRKFYDLFARASLGRAKR
jgi:hypothetical protein